VVDERRVRFGGEVFFDGIQLPPQPAISHERSSSVHLIRFAEQ
jgi:hypothetical protein